MTERTDKKYIIWNTRDTIRYLRKTLAAGKECRSDGWALLTPDDIEYMNKKIAQLKSELPYDEDMFMTAAEQDEELKKIRDDDIGEFESCDAYACSVCGGYIDDIELESVEQGTLSTGEEVFECPFCGSWNRCD